MAFAAAAFALLVTLTPPQFSGSHRSSANITLPAVPSSPAFPASWARWEWQAVTHATSADHAVFSAILPALFVGLLAPLVLLLVSTARAFPLPATPKLASLFQRPPPAQTL
ncbi:MAG TPA: hypothetical protein VMD29_03675 [Terracidiphilus sp.]|nr:hypothetical protein [Terracidiphilus sp.]